VASRPGALCIVSAPAQPRTQLHAPPRRISSAPQPECSRCVVCSRSRSREWTNEASNRCPAVGRWLLIEGRKRSRTGAKRRGQRARSRRSRRQLRLPPQRGGDHSGFECQGAHRSWRVGRHRIVPIRAPEGPRRSTHRHRLRQWLLPNAGGVAPRNKEVRSSDAPLSPKTNETPDSERRHGRRHSGLLQEPWRWGDHPGGELVGGAAGLRVGTVHPRRFGQVDRHPM
jgi:hypothetical protein